MKPLSISMNVDSGEKTWLTPPFILNALGHFDTDPCVPENMPWRTADVMYTKSEDGLKQQWKGRVWLNPPYGNDSIPFFKLMVQHKNSGGGIALVFARTDTRLWQDIIFPNASAVLFMKGRLKFHTPNGDLATGATAPSALVSFGESDADILKGCGLNGYFIKLT